MFKRWSSVYKSDSKHKAHGKKSSRPPVSGGTENGQANGSRPQTNGSRQTNGSSSATTGASATEENGSAGSQDGCKVDIAHLEFTGEQDEAYDPELDYKVINPDDANMPYGDGSDKVFGMENFGYTCYIASILQSLYYTEPLRREMLSFPHRNADQPRKRKLKVRGDKPHGFVAAIKAQKEKLEEAEAAGETTAAPETTPTAPSSASPSGTAKMKTIFMRQNSSGEKSAEKTGESSVDGSAEENSSPAPIVEDVELERNLLSRYAGFKDLSISYFYNHQSNLTLVGATLDASDTSEQRKRQALLRGPIINLDVSFSDEYGMPASLFTSLKDVFEAVAENHDKAGILSAYHFVEVVKQQNAMFRSSMHQDAHEFLNFLVNSLIETVNGYAAEHTSENSSLAHIFEGLLTSETKCLSCESVSTRDEKFLDLSIDLQQNTSISNCLKQFSQSEMLTGSNKFFCETCHSLQEAAKTIKLKKLPQILAFHLKRFKYSEELGRMVKLFYRVEYTKTLRISNTTDDTEEPDKFYALYSVVVHIGGGPYHGHYVALIKTTKFGWLLFDDETVESIDENYVFRFFGDGPGLSTAYLLFYREVRDKDAFQEGQLFNGLDDDEDNENFGTSSASSSGDSGVKDVPVPPQETPPAADSSVKPKKKTLLNFMKL